MLSIEIMHGLLFGLICVYVRVSYVLYQLRLLLPLIPKERYGKHYARLLDLATTKLSNGILILCILLFSMLFIDYIWLEWLISLLAIAYSYLFVRWLNKAQRLREEIRCM